MEFLCQYEGGSKIYGLSTPESDIDNRGVYLHNDVTEILSLKPEEFRICNPSTEDSKYYEIRRLFIDLANGRAHALECLWADYSKFTSIDDRFKELRIHRNKLVNTKGIYDSLVGFIKSQEHKVFDVEGNKRIKGSKRDERIVSVGYNYKSAHHIIRLSWAGCQLFDNGKYGVTMDKEDDAEGTIAFDIKTNPETFSIGEIKAIISDATERIEDSYNNYLTKKNNLFFDMNIANELIFDLYYPYIYKHKVGKCSSIEKGLGTAGHGWSGWYKDWFFKSNKWD